MMRIHGSWQKKLLSPAALLTGLYILVWLASLSFRPLDQTNLIDGAWQYSIAGFRHNTLQVFGSDVLFTYGPLAKNLITTVHHQDGLRDYIVSLLLSLPILGLAALTFYRAVARQKSNQKLAILCSLLLLSSTTQLDLLVFLSLIVTVPEMLRSSPRQRFLYMIPYLLLAFYKNTYLFALLAISLALWLEINQGRIRILYKLALAEGLALFGIFLVFTGLNASFVRYLTTAFQNAAVYSQYMSRPGFASRWLIYGLLASVVIYGAGLAYKFIMGRASVVDLCQAAVVLLAYRWASGRTFLAFLVLLPIILYITLNNLNLDIKRRRLVGTSVIAIFVVAALYIAPLPTPGQLAQRELTPLGNSMINPLAFFEMRDESQARYRQLVDQTEPLRSQLGSLVSPDQPIINLANASFYADTITGVVRHNPFLQHYAAFPVALFDQQYMTLLDRHPNELIFFSDQLASIDDRVALADLPKTFEKLRREYDIIAEDQAGRFFILKRKANPEAHRCQALGSHHGHFGEPWQPPQFNNDGGSLNVRFEFQDTLARKVKNFILPEDQFTIGYIVPGGIRSSYRASKDVLNYGLTIDPFPVSLAESKPRAAFNTMLAGYYISQPDLNGRALVIHFEKCN